MGQQTDKGPCFVELVTGHVSSIGLVDNNIEYNGETITVGTDSECSGECVLTPDEQVALCQWIGTGNIANGGDIAAAFPKLLPFMADDTDYSCIETSEDPVPCQEFVEDYMSEGG